MCEAPQPAATTRHRRRGSSTMGSTAAEAAAAAEGAHLGHAAQEDGAQRDDLRPLVVAAAGEECRRRAAFQLLCEALRQATCCRQATAAAIFSTQQQSPAALCWQGCLPAPELQRLRDCGPAGAILRRHPAPPIIERSRNQLLHSRTGRRAVAGSHQCAAATAPNSATAKRALRSHSRFQHPGHKRSIAREQHAPACWWGAAPRCACTAGPRCPALGTAPASPPGAAHRWCRGSPQSVEAGEGGGGRRSMHRPGERMQAHFKLHKCACQFTL